MSTSPKPALPPKEASSEPEESLAEQPAVENQTYTPKMLSERVFKTSNRIVEDIRFDVQFLESEMPLSILNSRTIDYSDKLTELVNSPLYDIHVLNNELSFCPSYRKLSSSSESIHVIKGLLVSKKNGVVSSKLSQCKVFHFTIKLKKRDNTRHDISKLNFFLINKRELFENDAKDLYSVQSISEVEGARKGNRALLHEALPKIVDSATYINFETQMLFHVEIHGACLSPKIVKQFEPEFIASLPKNIGKECPSQGESLKTLFKLVKGPLVEKNDRSLSGDHPVLDSHVSKTFLEEVLHHTKDGTGNFHPVDCHSPPNGRLVKSWLRKIMYEAIYYGVLIGASQFQDYSFNSALPVVYRVLGEKDINASIQYEHGYKNDMSNQLSFRNRDFVTLSIFSFYPTSQILQNYHCLRDSDDSATPIYLQSLVNVTQLFVSNFNDDRDLQVAVSKELSSGIVAYDALQKSANLLGFNTNDAPYQVIQSLLKISDNEITEAYKANICKDGSPKQDLKAALDTFKIFKRSRKIANFMACELMPLMSAYNELQANELVEDEIITIAYDCLKSEAGVTPDSAKLALLSIACYRRSHFIFNYIEQNVPSLLAAWVPDPFLLQDCYAKINVTDAAPDYEILTMADEQFRRINDEVITKLASYPIDDPYQFSDEFDAFIALRLALSKIQNARNSDVLSQYLEKGTIPPEAIPLNSWPVGLNNIGNTCYLNSLLQFYFVIKPLREHVLNFDKVFPESYNEEIATNETFKNRRIGGRQLSDKEVKRSYEMTYQLSNLFYDMIYSQDREVIPTKELAYLAFSPMIQEVEFEKVENEETNDEKTVNPDVNNEVKVNITNDENAISLEDDEDGEDQKMTPSNIKEFGDYEMVDPEPSIPSEDVEMVDDLVIPNTNKKPNRRRSVGAAKISFDQLYNTLEIGRQQDVTECTENVLFQLEASFDPLYLNEDSEQYDIIKKMFYGKTKQAITPYKNPEKERFKTEQFLNLFVNVSSKPKDLYEALDESFKPDDMTLEGNEHVQRSLAITELPEILQIQISRVEYDLRRGIAIKNIHPLPFEETIYMDRYMEPTTPEFKEKRQNVFKKRDELTAAKEKLGTLTKKQDNGLTSREALMCTKTYLCSEDFLAHGINFKKETIELLEAEIEAIDKTVAELKTKIEVLDKEIVEQFNVPEYKKIGYKLFAIFIHRGEASYGHYWIYIKDPKRNVYRKYNDETVTEVELSEVLNFQEGNRATPYFVVYAKEDFYQDGIEPLKRVAQID